MRILILAFMAMLVVMGCASNGQPADVRIQWYNLSTNEIWITGLAGLPPDASPGRLTPNSAETRLERSETAFSVAVGIEDRIEITWRDNGTNGWPGGLKRFERTPPGTEHKALLKRDELQLPPKLTGGTIRFTFQRNGKWRVRLLKPDEM